MTPSSNPNRPKRTAGQWSSSRVLNSSSPITSKDIHSFLVRCVTGWEENYKEEEKRAIIESLPSAYQKFDLDNEGKLKCPISKDFVQEDGYVKAAVSRFKNDVIDGYYQSHWQNQGQRAMQERREGKFDEYLREYAENMFGGHNDEKDHQNTSSTRKTNDVDQTNK